MPRYEMLNNIAHRDLRVATGFGPEFGDAVGMVPAYPSEFAELQREYPIFLRKDAATGQWQSVVLLGFEQHENLYLQDGRWNASYLPGAAAKGPFSDSGFCTAPSTWYSSAWAARGARSRASRK